MSPPDPDLLKPRFRILSLDGGGIRGGFAAGYLAEIERVVGRPLGEFFDLIAGTSTGGIIAAGLAYRVPAAEIERFYRERGPRIFRRRWWSPSSWGPVLQWLDYPLRLIYRPPLVVLDQLLLRWIGLDAAWIGMTKYSERELTSALKKVFDDQTIAQASK